MASSEDLSYAFLEAHPSDAARVLERLAPVSAAALLQSEPLSLASPVLRCFAAERRAKLLANLPTALTITYEMLLGYPEGTVGAWMDPNPKALLTGPTLPAS